MTDAICWQSDALPRFAPLPLGNGAAAGAAAPVVHRNPPHHDAEAAAAAAIAKSLAAAAIHDSAMHDPPAVPAVGGKHDSAVGGKHDSAKPATSSASLFEERLEALLPR